LLDVVLHVMTLFCPLKRCKKIRYSISCVTQQDELKSETETGKETDEDETDIGDETDIEESTGRGIHLTTFNNCLNVIFNFVILYLF